MLICAECIMRRRIASFEAGGGEPPRDARVTDGLPPLRAAQTVMSGAALCAEHVVELAPIQQVSRLVDPSGGNLVVPAGLNGTPQ